MDSGCEEGNGRRVFWTVVKHVQESWSGELEESSTAAGGQTVRGIMGIHETEAVATIRPSGPRRQGKSHWFSLKMKRKPLRGCKQAQICVFRKVPLAAVLRTTQRSNKISYCHSPSQRWRYFMEVRGGDEGKMDKSGEKWMKAGKLLAMLKTTM